MQKLLLLSLVFLVSFSCFAQPQHVSALVTGHFEGSGSGNGTIVGVEVQNVHDFRVYGEPLKLVSNVSFTLDEKVYRHQFGGAVRGTALARYAVDKIGRNFFVQAGVQAGGIAFPNTPGSNDGYVKYTWRPVVGGGASFVRDEWSVAVDYQFHVKRKLWANALPITAQNRIVDGWTSGHRIGAATTFQLRNSERWLLLFNASSGWNTYQRNAAIYGAQLGSVVHRFNDYQASIGIGRKY